MSRVKFTATTEERILIRKIADRAKKLGLIFKNYDRQTCLMDLEACHCNGTPLDLQRLLDAETFTFMHDVTKIARHIDRNTGKLTDHFLPRCHASQQKAKAAKALDLTRGLSGKIMKGGATGKPKILKGKAREKARATIIRRRARDQAHV